MRLTTSGVLAVASSRWRHVAHDMVCGHRKTPCRGWLGMPSNGAATAQSGNSANAFDRNRLVSAASDTHVASLALIAREEKCRDVGATGGPIPCIAAPGVAELLFSIGRRRRGS
jgi:hypothetical protein